MTVLATSAIDEAPSCRVVTDTYEYDAFGNQITHTGTTPNNYLYRGEQYDSDLGLYYLRARYYNPLTGRFMSRDPEDGDVTNPATLHKYLYASGDPVNHVDPTGRAVVETETVILPQVIKAGAALTLQALGTACLLRFGATGTTAFVNYGIDYGQRRNPSIQAKGWCALEEESKGDDCHQEHPDWPVNYVYSSEMPTIAAHIATAIAQGRPDALTYPGPGQQGPNRRAACPKGKYLPPDSCDEYPYASTKEGGQNASTWPVPKEEQDIQRNSLSQFYGSFQNTPGKKFCVVVTY